MVPEFGLLVMDATLAIEDQQKQFRQVVEQKLAQAKRLRSPSVA